MDNLLNLNILIKTFDDLPTGVGVFHVSDFNDLESVQYVYMNKIILHEMRKTKEEVFGKRIIDVAPEAYAHEVGRQVIETYCRVAEEGGSVNLGIVEYSNHLVAGKYECSVHNIQEHYVYVMLRNVTELEAKKNELLLKNKELEQFAYVASHDLKDPINSIKAAVEVLEVTIEEDEEALEMINFISNATDRMQNLITSLLSYSNIGADKEAQEVDCAVLLEAIKQDLGARIRETGSQLNINELPKIKAHRTELRLLFQNLITNAIKFQKPNSTPQITINAIEEDTKWVFSVSDNGIGIQADKLERVFNIFERLNNKNEYEGSGIGLAHCKKIVDIHKGLIWVESEFGSGSTFFFSIPKDL